MTLPFFTILTGAVSLIVAYFLWLRNAECNRRTNFVDRDSPSFNDWFEKNYGRSGYDPELVKIVINYLSQVVGAAPTQFLPSDQIRGNLSFGPGALLLNDPLAEFYQLLEDFARDRGLKPWNLTANEKTLDDVIKSFIAHINTQSTNAGIS